MSNIFEETTRKINIKKLDNSILSLEVPHDIKIPELKNKLHLITNILPELQRLIYHGRVLKNECNLDEYIKEDNQTIHLVENTLQTTTATTNVQPAGNVPQNIRPHHVQSIGVAAVIQGNAPQNGIRWTNT
jgi:hypothetical protein